MPPETDSVAGSSDRANGSGAHRFAMTSDGDAERGARAPREEDRNSQGRSAGPNSSARGAVAIGALGVLLLGTGIRVAMAAQNRLGHLPDTDFFLGWTRGLVAHGLDGFHAATRFCDYPPLSLLTMWAIGHVAAMFESALSNEQLMRTLLKAPACLADLAITALLFVEGRRLLGARKALGAAALYYLNPLSIYNSAYWGQVDAIHTAFVLLGIVFVSRSRWGLAGGAVALAMLQKFQSIAFVPLLLFDAYYHRRWRGVGVMLIGATVMAAWVLLPFAMSGSLDDVLYRAYVNVVGQYQSLTPSAYNVWQLTGTPLWNDSVVPQPVALAAAAGRLTFPADAAPLLWFSWRNISLVAYSLCVALILSIYSYRPRAVTRAGAAGLLGLAFFLIPTEMHERYAHPAIAFLALWAVTGAWKERAYYLLSVLLLLNLTAILRVDQIAMHIAASLVLLFVALLVWAAISNGLNDAGAVTEIPHAPPDEPMPPVSALVTWFRRGTYLSLVAACVGVVAVGYACKESHATLSRDDTVYVSGLRPVVSRQGWGELGRDRAVLGGPIRLGDTAYMRGLGTHAPSQLTYDIPEGIEAFNAIVGVDWAADEKGSVVASVELDGRKVFETGVLTRGDEPVSVGIPISGARRITLRGGPSADGVTADHLSWALARFE